MPRAAKSCFYFAARRPRYSQRFESTLLALLADRPVVMPSFHLECPSVGGRRPGEYRGTGAVGGGLLGYIALTRTTGAKDPAVFWRI